MQFWSENLARHNTTYIQIGQAFLSAGSLVKSMAKFFLLGLGLLWCKLLINLARGLARGLGLIFMTLWLISKSDPLLCALNLKIGLPKLAELCNSPFVCFEFPLPPFSKIIAESDAVRALEGTLFWCNLGLLRYPSCWAKGLCNSRRFAPFCPLFSEFGIARLSFVSLVVRLMSRGWASCRIEKNGWVLLSW